MNKHPFRRRALALLLSLVCVLGLLPPANVFAADDSIPNEITLKEADYPTGASANGLETYQAPNGLDEVTIHNFRVTADGKELTGFCGDHRKLMEHGGRRRSGRTPAPLTPTLIRCSRTTTGRMRTRSLLKAAQAAGQIKLQTHTSSA